MEFKPKPSAGATGGIVYLAGAGPGDPGLLTVRARELLDLCDVLVYDALVSPEVLALCPRRLERIYVGKRGGRHAAEQDEICALLAELAGAGKQVLRLKGGDPYLFGRGAEEALYLAERGITVEVVPGVTAGIAAPACAGIPVTHRDHASAVAFVTGHEDPSKPESALDWAALAKVGTLCFYMGVKNLGRIVAELSKHLPRSTPAAVIQWGTTPRQRTAHGTLADIEARTLAAGLAAPALTIVGAVAGLRDRLAFFERRPLFGRRVLVTRAAEQAGRLARELEVQGAEVLHLPTLHLEPPEDPRALAEAAGRLAAFDWVVFTSVNAVDAVWAELQRQGRDARAFGAVRVAAVGPATAERLAAQGLRADLVPPKFVGEEIVASLIQAGVFSGTRPLRFLLPRADIARPDLPKLLREQGAEVTEVAAYRTVPETEGQEEALDALTRGEVDAATFTSGSTARHFARLLGPERLARALASPRLKCLSIGPLTSAAMRDEGLPVHGEAARHDIPGLLELVIEQVRAV